MLKVKCINFGITTTSSTSSLTTKKFTQWLATIFPCLSLPCHGLHCQSLLRLEFLVTFRTWHLGVSRPVLDQWFLIFSSVVTEPTHSHNFYSSNSLCDFACELPNEIYSFHKVHHRRQEASKSWNQYLNQESSFLFPVSFNFLFLSSSVASSPMKTGLMSWSSFNGQLRLCTTAS